MTLARGCWKGSQCLPSPAAAMMGTVCVVAHRTKNAKHWEEAQQHLDRAGQVSVISKGLEELFEWSGGQLI